MFKNKFKEVDAKIFYSFFLLFIFAIFFTDRSIYTKLFYLMNVVALIYYVKNPILISRFFKSKIFTACFVLILYSLLASIIFGQFEFKDIKASVRLLFFLSVFLFSLSRDRDAKILTNIIIISVFLGSIPDLYSYIDSGAYVSQTPYGRGGKYMWHIFAGGVYSIALLLSMYLATSTKTISLKIIYASFLIYMCFLIYLTQSRAAILSVIISALVYIFLRKKSIVKTLIYSCAALFLGVVFSFLSIYDSSSLVARADAGRFAIWSKYIDLVYQAPLFGRGLGWKHNVYYNDISYVTEPHNLYLYALVTGGLVCLVLLFWVYFEVLKVLYKNYMTNLGAIFISCFIYVAVFNFFDSRKIVDDVGIGWIIFWIPIGFVAALEYLNICDECPDLNTGS